MVFSVLKSCEIPMQVGYIKFSIFC